MDFTKLKEPHYQAFEMCTNTDCHALKDRMLTISHFF